MSKNILFWWRRHIENKWVNVNFLTSHFENTYLPIYLFFLYRKFKDRKIEFANKYYSNFFYIQTKGILYIMIYPIIYTFFRALIAGLLEIYNTLKPWFNEPQYSEFRDSKQNQVPILRIYYAYYIWYSELLDIVNKKGIMDLFVISRFTKHITFDIVNYLT